MTQGVLCSFGEDIFSGFPLPEFDTDSHMHNLLPTGTSTPEIARWVPTLPAHTVLHDKRQRTSQGSAIQHRDP